MRSILLVMVALSAAAGFASSTALASVPAGICGPDPLPCSADCSLLSGDACREACNDVAWAEICVEDCCAPGTPYPPADWDTQCDVKCHAHCVYNRWGDCYYDWCEGDVLFCDGAPLDVDNLQVCLNAMCKQKYDIENYTCTCA